MKAHTTRLDEAPTKEQLTAIARRYRPRMRGMSRYIPHSGARERERNLKRLRAAEGNGG